MIIRDYSTIDESSTPQNPHPYKISCADIIKNDVNTTIVIGHCIYRSQKLEHADKQHNYKLCSLLNDSNVNDGCVFADCFNDSGIPKLIFVDTSMSQAFFESDTENIKTHEHRENEFLLLEHIEDIEDTEDTEDNKQQLSLFKKLATLVTSQPKSRWINKISRKKANSEELRISLYPTQKSIDDKETETLQKAYNAAVNYTKTMKVSKG